MTLKTAGQLRAARSLLGWHQTDLERASGVSRSTLKRMEHAEGDLDARQSTITAVQLALERAGVQFLNGDQPGVRMARNDRDG